MKKIRLFLLFLSFVFIVGCTDKTEEKTTEKALNNNPTSSQVSVGVNMDDLGNIMNGQYYFDDGNQIFYSTFDETGASHIYMQQNGTTLSIFNGFGWSFALKDGYLYFSGNEGTKIDGTYNLFKMKIADGSYQKINTSYCFNMYFYDDYLYYSKELSEDVYAVYRSNLDGTNETKIVDNSYSSIVYESKLYYLQDDKIYEADPNGLNAKVILNDDVVQFIIGQGKIIYLDLNNDIKMSDINGANINTIRMASGLEVYKINSYKDTIFYVVDKDTYLSDRLAYSYSLYSIKIDGTNDKKVYDGVSYGYYINIVKDKVYALDYAQDLTINKFVAITSNMNLDGTSITKLYRK